MAEQVEAPRPVRIKPLQLAVLLSDGIMRVGLTLGHGRSLMHGVAPQCAVE
jgi:hypothetical protein